MKTIERDSQSWVVLGLQCVTVRCDKETQIRFKMQKEAALGSDND